jgi:hypothetical protein
MPVSTLPLDVGCVLDCTHTTPLYDAVAGGADWLLRANHLRVEYNPIDSSG